MKKITVEGGLRNSAYCSGIIFEDSKSKEVLKWKSRPDYFSKSQEVPDGEVLVGIYGRFNHKFSGIQNFGFVTAKYTKEHETELTEVEEELAVEVEEAEPEVEAKAEPQAVEGTKPKRGNLKISVKTEMVDSVKDVSFAGSDDEKSVDLTSESIANYRTKD